MSDSSTLVLLHLDGDLTNSGVSPAKFTVDNGSPKFVDNPKFGTKCLQFEGRSSIACPYGMGSITLGNQFTIDFWAKYNNWQSKSCLFTIGTTGNTNAISLSTLRWYSTSIEYAFGTSFGAAETSFRIDMDKNWHHFAFTYNNEYYDLFVDGKKKISKFHYKFNPQSSYKIRFGGSAGVTNEYWLNGYMDEIRISNCVRYTSDFTPEGGAYSTMAVIDQKVIDALKDNGKNFCFRKAVTTLKVPTYNNYELDHVFCDHRANAWVKRSDIVSCFPVKTDAADIYGAQWTKHGNVAFMTDPKKNPWEIGRQFYRCTNTDITNGWMNISTNLGSNCSFECWFRLSSSSQAKVRADIMASTDFGIAADIENGKCTLCTYGQVKAPNGDANITMSGIPSTLNTWHHLFYCAVGTKLLIAVDGKWIKDVIPIKSADTVYFHLGNWNDTNRDLKGSIVDFAAICLRKTDRPLPKDTMSAGFRLVECWHEYSVRNGMIGEPRWSFLRQDIQNSRFYAKAAGGTYGIDPMTDPTNFETSSQMMCITDVNGQLADKTGKTQWTATNVVPNHNRLDTPYSFYTSDKFGKFIKSGGQDIIIGRNDFTFLVDFYIYGKNAYNKDLGNLENNHYVISGEEDCFEVAVVNDLHMISVGPSGGKQGYLNIGDNLKFNTWYRFIVQRRNGIMDAWLNGVHIYVQQPETRNYSGKITWIGGNSDTERLNLRGGLHNVVLWNKALFPTGQIIYDAERKNSIMKKVGYMTDPDPTIGIGRDGFYTLNGGA